MNRSTKYELSRAKKISLLLSNLVFVASIGFAQMKVVNNGNASLGTSPNTDAKLRTQSATMYGINVINTGITVPNGNYTSGTAYGIYANTTATGYGSDIRGAYLESYSSNNAYSASVHGLYAKSSTTATIGSSYGVRSEASATYSNPTIYGVHSKVTGVNAANTYAGYFTGGKVVVMDGALGLSTTTPKETFQIGGIWTFHNGHTKYIGRNTAWDYVANNTNRRIEAGHTSLIGFSTEGSIQMETFGRGAANSTLSRVGYLVLDSLGRVGVGKNPASGRALDVNGGVWANNVQLTSDERLKSNIKNVTDETEKLYKLQGKSYTKTLEPTDMIQERDTTTFFEYGYLAQELKEVFPELVSQDTETGYYAVNYIALIPVIIEALKDQQKTIATLQQKLEGKETAGNTLKSGDASVSSTSSATTATQNMYLSENATVEDLKLYQNAPNPFNQRTTVKCFVPEQFQKVQLCVYNMQGVQVQCITITERGAVSIEIEARTLSAGIYSYVLLADGAASETKQMILTK